MIPDDGMPSPAQIDATLRSLYSFDPSRILERMQAHVSCEHARRCPRADEYWNPTILTIRGSAVAFWVPACRGSMYLPPGKIVGLAADVFRVFPVGEEMAMQALRPYASGRDSTSWWRALYTDIPRLYESSATQYWDMHEIQRWCRMQRPLHCSLCKRSWDLQWGVTEKAHVGEAVCPDCRSVIVTRAQHQEERSWLKKARVLRRAVRQMLKNPSNLPEVLQSLPEELKPEKILPS